MREEAKLEKDEKEENGEDEKGKGTKLEEEEKEEPVEGGVREKAIRGGGLGDV